MVFVKIVLSALALPVLMMSSASAGPGCQSSEPLRPMARLTVTQLDADNSSGLPPFPVPMATLFSNTCSAQVKVRIAQVPAQNLVVDLITRNPRTGQINGTFRIPQQFIQQLDASSVEVDLGLGFPNVIDARGGILSLGIGRPGPFKDGIVIKRGVYLIQ